MAKSVHITTLRKMLAGKEALDLKFWDKTGNVIHANSVICTSTYYHNNTANIKFLQSGQFRKLHVLCIFEVNGMEVFI